MDDNGNMDVDPSSSAAATNGNFARRGSGPSSPRATKALPAGSSQRSLRATSVEMADAAPNGGSGSSETEASNADSSATSVEATQQVDIPSLDEQVAKVMIMTQQQLQDRQEGYVISESWLERVFARTSENSNRPEQFSKEATQGPIGPVDNSNLVDADALLEDLDDQRGEDFIPLRKGLQMGQDFEVLPAKAWELVLGWYGLKANSPTIRRYAHNTSTDKYRENLEYELFPPILTIRKVRKSAHPAGEAEKRAEKMVVSRSDSYASFLDTAKKAVGISPSKKVRVWRIIKTIGTEQPTTTSSQQPSGILTPDASPRDGSPDSSSGQRPSLVMDAATFNGLAYGTEREIVGKDDKPNEDFNDQLTVGIAGLGEDQTIVLEEHDDKGEYLSDSLKALSKSKAGLKGNKGLQSGPNSGRSTPAPGGPMTRGRTRTGRVRGTVGLTNLGNTCYMNSALQCIRSVEELSTFFLTSKWKEELNEDNPLGHNGSIARAYSGLLSAIYGENANSSFAPKNFKQTLGRAQPIFSGYGQQDSQEFLSFLVDGLHEDLNRIKKKPYTENPESDDNIVHDPEAIKALGEKFRAIHRSRNDSVAMDLFNGFYKNTMVCPDCDKVSITFDPYSLLTLQLPIEQTWTHTVTFVPLRGKLHQVEVDMDKNASIKALKEYVGKRFGVKANYLMASEVYNHKFYRHLYDYHTIAESNIGQRDDIWVYELDSVPSNWPPPENKERKYRSLLFTASSDEDIPDSSSPVHDRVLIPVFHRGPNMSTTYQSKNWSMALWPTYVVLTREEAKDYDAILKKVLRNVSQMTTRPILTEFAGSSLDQSRSGSDVVLTTEEDASPNGDPRVKDGSIEGEDMVEVTMTEPAQTSADQTDDQEDLPEVLKPGTFVPPEFRQLFEIKHTRADNQMVTNGWSTVDHSKALESISKRIRLPPSRQSSMVSSTAASEASSSEETDEPQFSVDANDAIEAANVSSDEEMKSIEEPPSFSRGGRQKKSKKKSKHQRRLERKHMNNKNFKSYSKKGKIPEQPSPPSYPDNEEDESLIRMGEAIVLEWIPDAFDALFNGSSQDDARGMDTLKFIEHLEDPELDEKKARRAARRKNGITLEECFSETSKSEVLSEDNAWYCNRCKELRRATKTLEIWTVPDILVIHLKRFSAHRSFRDKIEALVDFPIEGLDLTGKVGLPEGKELIYDLFAVDNHFGGLGGGHYTAFAQNFFDKQWYDYNDSMVSKHSNPKDAVTRNAYLLFYRRRSPAPLGPPELQKIVNEANSAGSEEEEESDEDNLPNTSRDPSGNGSRLGDSSRNGSSSAFGAGAGAVALRGGGLASAGSLALKGAGAGTLDDDMDEGLPGYDEGYDDDEGFSGIDINTTYAPLHQNYDQPAWSFNGVPRTSGSNDDVFDDAASDAPNLGSQVGDELNNRMLEDFGDELGTRAGAGTPLEEEVPMALGGEHGDGEVAEIHVKSD